MSADQLLRTLWRRKLYVILTVVLATAGAYFLGRELPKVYSSSSTLFIGNSNRTTSSYEALQSDQLLAKTYGELIQSKNVAASVALALAQTGDTGRTVTERDLDALPFPSAPVGATGATGATGVAGATGASGPTGATAIAPAARLPEDALSPEEVLGRTSFESVSETQLIVVTAEGPTAAEAAQLANAYGTVFERYANRLLAERTLSRVSVVDPARVPGSPIRPQPRLYAAVMFVLALFLGLGIALLRDRFDTKLGDAEALGEAVDLPLLAQVPLIAGKRPSRSQQQSFEESFRVLRTNLQFLGGRNELLRCFAVCSAGPGEGKSTTVIGLARAFGEQGRRVLVIEGDLRRPSLAPRLGVDPEATGVAHFLAMSLELDEVTYETNIPGVFLIPAGAVPPSAASLLSSEAIHELVHAAVGAFDAVLLDCPPASAGADATILADAADGVLFVVNQRRTARPRAMRAIKALRRTGATLAGLILNEGSGGDDAYAGYYGTDVKDLPVAERPASRTSS